MSLSVYYDRKFHHLKQKRSWKLVLLVGWKATTRLLFESEQTKRTNSRCWLFLLRSK